MNKKGFEFSFSWIFAMIVGVAVLFLAVYGASKLLKTGEYQQSTETAKQLTIIFDPLGTEEGTAKSGRVTLNAPIKMSSDCYTDGSFGRQVFYTSQSKGLTAAEQRGAGIESSNKYIFTEGMLEEREFNYFSKSLEMPFKVADIIILTTKKYCFIEPPTLIKEEIESLGLKNIIVAGGLQDCVRNLEGVKKENVVCFGSDYSQNSCGIRVTSMGSNDYASGFVESGTKKKYFAESLIYPAIMSDNYECNTKRIMMRLNALTKLYLEKSRLLTIRGVCDSGLDSGLLSLGSAANQFNISRQSDLINIHSLSKTISQSGSCELW